MTTTKTTRRTFLKQLGLGAGGVALVTGLSEPLLAQSLAGDKFLRSTPEAQGVSSEGILAFLDAVAKSNHEFHSFMVVRHGQVVAEGWWSPYRADLNHTLYSLSKSFTSTAVGLAVTDGKLTVENAVTSFFPDDLPKDVGDNLAALRVKHLLTMSVGHETDSTPTIVKEQNWVRSFLSLPIKNAPGTAFLYNSGATYMLSAIVQKVTGQKVIDFLTPRLFTPLDIKGVTWETCPRGINTGGWGLSVRTEALAKFGQMYLQKGMWRGKQIVPSKWVEEATTFKIQQPAKDLEREKRESDWHQGYCYQFWRCRHDAFRGDGAFGQFMIVMPEQDAVVAITCETSNMQSELNLVWDHLLPAMQADAHPPNREKQAELKARLSSLALPLPKGQAASPLVAKISGKQFKLEENDLGASSVTFNFKKHACVFSLKSADGEYPITCGYDAWTPGETSMPGTPPRLVAGKGSETSKVTASAAWQDDNTFAMTWRFCETPHHDTVTSHFDGGKVRIEFLSSIAQLSPARKVKQPVLQGEMVG